MTAAPPLTAMAARRNFWASAAAAAAISSVVEQTLTFNASALNFCIGVSMVASVPLYSVAIGRVRAALDSMSVQKMRRFNCIGSFGAINAYNEYYLQVMPREIKGDFF